LCYPLSAQKLPPRDVSAPVFPSSFTLLGLMTWSAPLFVSIYYDASKASVRIDYNASSTVQINDDVYNFNLGIAFLNPIPCQHFNESVPLFPLPKLLNTVGNATVEGKNATVWYSSNNDYWYMGTDGVPLFMMADGGAIRVTSFSTDPIPDGTFDVPDHCSLSYEKKKFIPKPFVWKFGKFRG